MPKSNLQRKNNTVLVIAAHHDDEVLGCAGTIYKHIKNGDKVSIIFLSDGSSSRQTNEQSSRHNLADEVATNLGVEKIYSFDFPDNKMDSVPLLEIIQKIEPIIETARPNIIYTHYSNDLNIDHSITHKATLTACRPTPNSTVEKIFSFEILSSTEWTSPSMGNSFTPNYFVDITEEIDKKIEVSKIYKDEFRDFPHSRSLENLRNLAALRGATVGLQFAEAFKVERIISR